MWSALSKTLKLMVIMVLVVLGLSFAGVMSLVLKSCDDDNSKSGLTTKEDLKGLATKGDIKGLKEDVAKTPTKVDLNRLSANVKDLATKGDLGDLATKEDLKPLATKSDLLTLCNQTKDATTVAQPDPPKVTTPPPASDPPKTAPVKRTYRAHKPKQVAPPTTDPALASKVSNLETRMARVEHVIKPLSDYADKYGPEYHARLKARLDALDRLPDKVQGESK